MVEKKAPLPHEVTVIDTIRMAIRVICGGVFLGYLIMWIMPPTNLYWSKWWPSIQNKANSTYLQTQGINILTYTFPILFIAVLGCAYVHLGEKLHDNNSFQSNCKKHSLASWRRPLVVKGPLGIVNGTELGFFIMFLTLLVWSFSIMVHETFKIVTPQLSAAKKEQMWQTKLYSASTNLGLTGNIALSFLFFPVARFSSVQPLLGLSYEGCIKYHNWLGHIVMIIFTAHGLGHIIYWATANRISEMLKWQNDKISNLPGEVALIAGVVLWATSLSGIRRRMFELFYYTHHLYVVFMVFFAFHLGISYFCITLPSFYLFIVDRCLRFLQSRQNVRLVSARTLPCQTLELNFAKTTELSYNPTSMMFINVPSISKLQWHPFSIHSNSNLEPETLSVIIKSEGSWGKRLYQMVSSPSAIDRLQICIEGPYGPSSTHFLIRHDTLVMVSGGSGITPFISLIRELIFTSEKFKCETPKVILICAFKTSSDLTMLDLLLPISGTPSGISNLQLQIEAYVTRERESIADNLKLTRTIWFKPSATDAPISSILGSHSWLWLGTIISSSFIIFLIIVGIITRYYIYPIDHNPNELFTNMAARAIINILVLCVCIAATASAVVIWCRKQNANQANQIQNMEGTKTEGSRKVLDNTNGELESQAHQAILQATNVHFGERPDLKRILLE